MSSVQPVNNITPTTNRKILTLKNTGYAALGGICLTCASAMTKYKPLRNKHKYFAFFTVLLTMLHVGVAMLHCHEYHKAHK